MPTENQLKVIETIKKIREVVQEPFIVMKSTDDIEHHDVDILIHSVDFPLPMHLHTEIDWGGAKPISNLFMWENSIETEWNGLKIRIPNELGNAILSLAHAVFETGKLTKKEIVEINNLYPFDSERITKLDLEAFLCGWEKTYIKVRKWMGRVEKQDKEIFNIPFDILLSGVMETQTWAKLWGARFILKERIFGKAKPKIKNCGC